MCVGGSKTPKVSNPAAVQYASAAKLAPMRLSDAALASLRGLGTSTQSLRIGGTVAPGAANPGMSSSVTQNPEAALKARQSTPSSILKI